MYYICQNKFCSRAKKSIRARIVFDFVYEFLEKGLNFGEKEYKDYLEHMSKFQGIEREKASIKLHSKEALMKQLRSEINNISYKILDFEKGSLVRINNENRLLQNQDELSKLNIETENIRNLLKDPEEKKVTVKEFLNLSRNASSAIQRGDAVIKDAICRLIFLNFTVDESKVASYQLKPPFDELLKTRKSYLVGERGLEPPTSRSQTARSSQLSYSPSFCILSAAERTRTLHALADKGS